MDVDSTKALPSTALSSFLTSVSSLPPPTASSSISAHRAASKKALELLRTSPSAARDACLALHASLADYVCDVHFSGPARPQQVQQKASAVATLEDLASKLRVLSATSSTWSPAVAAWAMATLGELATKYSSRLPCQNSPGSAASVHDTLPAWLECPSIRVLLDLTALSLEELSNSQEQTEACISVLLDTSVKHSPHFDWVVAHLGSCFPDTVISRILNVGLKDFCQSAETQLKKDGKFTLTRVPKLNSVIGILGHLASAHSNKIKSALLDLATQSLQGPIKAMNQQMTATIPYLLHLASLSDSLSAALFSDLYPQLVDADAADKVAMLADKWRKKFFTAGSGEDDPLASLVVHLIICADGSGGADAVRALLELASEDSDSGRDVRGGCRQLLELVLCELQALVHQKSKLHSEEIALLKALSKESQQRFLYGYVFAEDIFHKRFTVTLLAYLSLQHGPNVAINTIKFMLYNAEDVEDLSSLFEFLREVELFQPEVLELAVGHCLREARTLKTKELTTDEEEETEGDDTERLLKNLGSALQSQRSENSSFKILSSFADALSDKHSSLLPFLGCRTLTSLVLKIFFFVPLNASEVSMTVSLAFRAAHCLSHTVFSLIEAREEDTPELLAACTKCLLDITAMPSGLVVVLRFLMEGALQSRFSYLFGGRQTSSSSSRSVVGKETSLLAENRKFGSMPARPLGAATVFHAGVIGDGKRSEVNRNPFTREQLDLNQYGFLCVLFKICHAGSRDRSKEACRQLALLLVDMVSPDVMYNGLPWPDEDFARVTVERDLRIAKTFAEHPLLWRVLMGLAEARPALCYCSVLIRALMATQISFWQGSVATRADQCPKQMETLKKILELMSIGQFLPHPLNALSDVIFCFHAFHVHCILVDVWNFMKDNVPSPVAFAAKGAGPLNREFEPYKNYRSYCERLRLIMMHHVSELPKEFKRFFVDMANRQEEDLKLAMHY